MVVASMAMAGAYVSLSVWAEQEDARPRRINRNHRPVVPYLPRAGLLCSATAHPPVQCTPDAHGCRHAPGRIRPLLIVLHLAAVAAALAPSRTRAQPQPAPPGPLRSRRPRHAVPVPVANSNAAAADDDAAPPPPRGQAAPSSQAVAEAADHVHQRRRR